MFIATTALLALGQNPSPTQQQAPSAAQQQDPSPVQQSGAADAAPQPPSQPPVVPTVFSVQSSSGAITEDQIKHMLAGKTFFLRSGYLDNTLNFDEQGRLVGHSPQGSYTLCEVQINKVRVTKRNVELEGDRFGLHFLGALPYEDPTKATDAVKITPKKKVVKITFDRERVESPKKKKEKGKKDSHGPASNSPGPSQSPSLQSSSNSVESAPASVGSASPVNPAQKSESAAETNRTTTTASPAHASQMLLAAFDRVFAPGIDDRMIAAMPDFWKLYYQAAEAKTDYKPTDPAIFRQSAVDEKAKLISTIEPPSNEYAQANGVAGIALYHAVIGSDGKAEEIVAGRPIGFGLDESAVETIRKAGFQPAIKGGKPVPVVLDLVVSFRIYSKRTSESGASSTTQQATDQQPQATLPGPYSVGHP